MAFEVEFSKRLDLFGAEIFAALNDKKVALEAQGKKLYNLSVGTRTLSRCRTSSRHCAMPPW